MLLVGRSWEGSYRYTFNNLESQNNIANYEILSSQFREYNPNIGRWFSLDNKVKSYQSNYIAFGNNPIVLIDPKGADEFYFNTDGTWTVKITNSNHVFYMQKDDGTYRYMEVHNKDWEGWDWGREFIKGMFDIADGQILEDMCDDDEALSLWLYQRQTTEVNKEIWALIDAWGYIENYLDGAELAVDIWTGGAKVIFKEGVKYTFKKATTKIVAKQVVKNGIIENPLNTYKYKASPKHSNPNNKDPKVTYMDLTDEEAQELLNYSIQGAKGKQLYGYKNGKIYEFQPDNAGTYHGYPVKGNEVPSDVLKKFKEDNTITQVEYNKFVKGQQ